MLGVGDAALLFVEPVQWIWSRRSSAFARDSRDRPSARFDMNFCDLQPSRLYSLANPSDVALSEPGLRSHNGFPSSFVERNLLRSHGTPVTFGNTQAHERFEKVG